MASWNPRANEIFANALELDGPEERRAYLDQACTDDDAMRRQVDALLMAHAQAGDFLKQQPPAHPQATGAYTPQPEQMPTESFVPRDLSAGLVIAGRYTLAEKIGEGGMGEVWVAKQTVPVKRKVALKLVKPGMDSKAVVQRFEQERQALAMMDHPNIARVLDGGLTDDRRPFFVMELVNGLGLNRFCDEAKLAIRERLELFVAICQAVQHAHQKGIVHRDLKPSNILVTLIDGRAIPKVIDFGVAKATGGKLTDESMSTQFGAVIGTLEYMAPEQAGFAGIDVDTRADIYSLGIILYELLTGLRPFDGKRLRKAALDEMIRIIREEEPSKPSTRLSTDEALPSLAASRQMEPGRLTKLLRGELDWVVMKCLEKQRDRRYETANGLARDVQRYLADEAVEARPASAGYRMKKLLRRHKGPVLAASLILLALLTGIVGTTLGLIEAKRQEGLAQAAQRQEAERAEAEAKERRRAVTAEAEALAQKKLAETNAAEANKQEKVAREQLALSTAVTQFLQDDLLGQAGSMAQADRNFEPDPNLTIKDALDRAAATVGDKFRNRPELEASIRLTVGDAYRDVGRYDNAIFQLRTSAEIRRRQLGPDDPETLGALNNLAETYRLAGRPTEAIALHEQIRDASVRKLGPEHPDTLTTLDNLAHAYADAGQTNAAIALFEQARDARIKILGPDHPATLTTLNNLAGTYHRAGRTSDAIALFEQVRNAQVKLRGADHPHTLATLQNLGEVYRAAGKTTEAITLLELVREGRTKSLGAEHPETLITRNNLAVAYQAAGNMPVALAELEKVREAALKRLGPNHPLTLITLSNLASVYRATGKPAAAITLLEQVRGPQEKRFGPDHPNTLTILTNLAVLYAQTKQFDRSIPLLEQTLAVQRKKLGDQHPETLRTLANLGLIYQQSGRVKEAIPLLEQAYRGGRSHSSLKWVGGSLLKIYILAGKAAQGVVLVREQLEAARKDLPANSPALAEVLIGKASDLLQLKAWSDAEPILRECLAIREKQEPDDWRTFNTRSMLGEAQLGQKKYADAEPLLLAGYEGMKLREAKIPIEVKIRLTEALERIVRLYEATGQKDKAAEWRNRLSQRK